MSFYRDEQFDKLSEYWANVVIARERGAAKAKDVSAAFNAITDYLDARFQAATEAAKATAPASQDSAPAELPIRTWRERRDRASRALTTAECLALADMEIADLRAALAAAPVQVMYAPTDAEFEAWCERHDMRKDRSDHREMFDDAASLYLAAAPASPQPVAKVLTDEQITDIADDNDCGRTAKGYRLFSDRNLLSFARAILAASTPTTLTEKKE